MEFSIKMLVIFIMGLIVLFIVLILAYQLTGDSRDLVTWLIDSIKGMVGIDFNPKK
ncbi:MAG: hypothetical protein ISS93_02195 [Candidatus Aenigmarchaeota archaeon]|nr:hypothetical protein [Candidatus Aenigmarchaeota archaeon]